MPELRIVLKDLAESSKEGLSGLFNAAGFNFDWSFPGTNIFPLPAPEGDTWLLPLPVTVEKCDLNYSKTDLTTSGVEVVFSSRDGLIPLLK